MAKPLTPYSSIARLQLAQRIRQVLVREIDHAIEVDRLLTDARYARDVLLVCDALAGGEAPSLAAQFRLMPMPMPMPATATAAAAAAAGAGARGPDGAPGHAQQATDWARDSSGFGLSQPPPVAPVAGARPRAAEPPAGPPAGRPTSAADQRRNRLPRWRDSR